MKQLRIGIVEDELLIAESIAMALRQVGYHPLEAARNIPDALKMIQAESPDLLMIDISLEAGQNGIELAQLINRDYGIPFIFLTALSDPATVERAKETNPYAYLVKPFNEADLFSAIEIAFNNFNREIKSLRAPANGRDNNRDFMFIKQNDTFHRLDIHEILYLESDNVYLNIYTTKKHFVIRNRLDQFLDECGNGSIVKVHRSYAVNLKHAETIHALSVEIKGKHIPMHRTYKQELLQKIKSFT